MNQETSLRLEIPADATPEELADVCLALLSEPGVAAFVNHGSQYGEGDSGGNSLALSPLHFDVAALAASPACVGSLPHGCDIVADTASETVDPGETTGFWGAARALLSKALRVGGPAQAGLSMEEVLERQAAANGDIELRQQTLVADLTANFEAWDAAVESAQSGFGYMGQLTLEDAYHLQEKVWRVVERDARSVIREAYREMWMAGRAAAGNFKPLSRDEETQLAKMYRAQQNFYLNLLKDREMGTGKMDFSRRITMYGNALRQAFFAGRVLADLSGDVFYEWSLGESEHCGDCLKLANSGRWKNGVYSAREMAKMGVWPGSGDTECITECKCDLKRTKRPNSAPKGAAVDSVELVGPGGSPFHGMGRVDREKFARGVERNEWNHKGNRVLFKKKK